MSAAAVATILNGLFGLLLAWALTRYDFPGKRLIDAAVDLPFALPTAHCRPCPRDALLRRTAGSGACWSRWASRLPHAPLGIMIAMLFHQHPLVVRTVQPVLEDMSADVEEAGAALGLLRGRPSPISPGRPFFPAFLAGSLAFVQRAALANSVPLSLISGNLPFQTEVTALLVFIRLDEYDYPAAAALAFVMLVMAFSCSRDQSHPGKAASLCRTLTQPCRPATRGQSATF